MGADYGLTVLTGPDAERGLRLVMFILSPEGQEIVIRHGFAAGGVTPIPAQASRPRNSRSRRQR